MRILFTIHHELDGDAGAPGAVLQLRDAFRRKGHQADILSFGDLPFRLGSGAVKSAVFPWFCAPALARAASGTDVIDASSGDAWLYAGLRNRRRAPLLVSHSHGLEHVRHEQRLAGAARGDLRLSWRYGLYHGGFRLWECARSFRAADLALFLNGPDRDYAVEKLGVDRRRARVIGNGIPESLLNLDVDWSPGTAALTIALVGSYIPRKGIAVAASALAKVLAVRPELRVLFLGTGCPPERVHADYPADLHARIAVQPHFAHAELPRLLAGARILLFPSFAEGFPLAPLEAMACGLAPLVSAIPGPLEYIEDGRNGLTVPPGDAEGFAQVLQRLVDDRAWLARLREAAYRTAQTYPWRRIAAERLALYEEFLDRRRVRRGRAPC